MYYWGAPKSVGESSPEDVTSPLSADMMVVDVSAGSRYSIRVLEDGTAHVGGFIASKDADDYHGHFGIKGGDLQEGENPFQPIPSIYDTANDAIVDAPFFSRAFAGAASLASPGSIHSLFIDDQGQGWSTGSNIMGQLCTGDYDDRIIPVQIPLDATIIDVAIGSEHTLLLTDDGFVYGCGSNTAGQLGLGEDIEEVNIPTLIEGVSCVESISAGMGFSLFKASDGIYATGNNFYGQLCVQATTGTDVMTPFLIAEKNLDISIVNTFQAIETTSYILFNDGSVAACGRNNFGQHGNGDDIDRVRSMVTSIPSGNVIKRLGVGPSSNSAFFMSEDGVTLATGLNDRGQLGVGDTDDRYNATQVAFGSGAEAPQQVSASGDHTLSR